MAHRIRRQALVCLVVVALGTAPAWAAPSHREGRLASGLERAVAAAVHLWQSVWGKEGSSLDPFGLVDPSAGTGVAATPQGGDRDGTATLSTR